MSAKLFEVGDVLPAGPVKIEFSHYNSNGDYHSEGAVEFTEQDSITFIIQEDYFEMYEAYVSIIPVFTSNNYSIIDDTNSEDIAGYEQRDMYCYIIIDFSNCTLAERTVISINGEDYGTWEDLNPTPTGYSVTFEENGGSTVTDLTEQTNLPNPLPTPTKSNLVFGGWFYESTFTTKALANDTITSDVTLYAKWLDTSALLLKLNAIRNALKTSINAKGGTLTTETLDQYASAVDGIQIAVELTQAQYDALPVYDNNTYYLIVEV